MADITNIIEAVVAIIFIVASAIILPMLKAKLGNISVGNDKTALDLTIKWLEIAVWAAEEAARTGLIEKKAKYGYAKALLERQGVTFDEDTVEALINSKVYELFNQFRDDSGEDADE